MINWPNEEDEKKFSESCDNECSQEKCEYFENPYCAEYMAMKQFKKSIKPQIEALEAERDQLKKENERLRSENKFLIKLVGHQFGCEAELIEENAKLEAAVKEQKNYPTVEFKHIEGLTCPECKMFKTRCICKQIDS